MADYRCFCLDAQDEIMRVETVPLPDDEDAKRWGEVVLTENKTCTAIEVWDFARRVCRLERPAA
jgi:hypothetical protein